MIKTKLEKKENNIKKNFSFLDIIDIKSQVPEFQ